MNDLVERIRKAVAEGRQVRALYYAAISLPDEQQLGPPASEHQLLALERRLGKPLPPSYRTFLGLYDGWRMVDGGMDLLPTSEILDGARAEKIRKWQERARKYNDIVAANSLVIGDSTATPSKLLLDPCRVESGEWAAIQHTHEEEGEYPSFLAWIEESVTEFRELLEDQSAEDA